MLIDVSVAEIFDRLSILEIKKESGLDVESEYIKINDVFDDIISKKETLLFYYRILKTINLQMWIIEDLKREHELNKNFDQRFIDLSRSIYMINDERARVKKMVDILAESSYTEQKKHREYI